MIWKLCICALTRPPSFSYRSSYSTIYYSSRSSFLISFLTLFLLALSSSSTPSFSSTPSSSSFFSHETPYFIQHILQGIIDPFESSESVTIPPWKLMKDSGDKLASQHFYQAALTEYNQLIKHPYLFHDMPMIDKYDLFVTMAKLLKGMGYYSRAEMLLFEAIRYSNEPSDAYYQLSLLSLDKEDLHQAKIYFKNCLYYKENDIVLLVYLSTILLTEGKIYESKFYITRILSHLELKITQLSLLLNKDPQDLLKKDTHSSSSPATAAAAAHEHHIFRSNLEDLVIKIYSCEYLLIPSATLETYKFFTTLLDWIQRDEMNGRFLFDLGQSLYERGKATVGLSIMHHGQQTSDIATEGMVSMQVIHLRVALEYPLVPSSLLEILEHYLNITEFLARGSTADRRIDLENIIDLYWPLPLLSWSHLPMAPVLEEFVMSYFHHFPIRSDYLSQLWLTHHLTINTCLPYPSHSMNSHVLSLEEKRREQRFLELEHQYGAPEIMKYRQIDIFKKLPNHRNAMLRDIGFPIELGVLGGHFNSHPVGHFLLHRFLKHFNPHKRFSVTLIALPLIPDHLTRRIARYADRIINLPADPTQGWALLQRLSLDILLFPDWQPFPDTQSVFYQASRIAPIQICLFTRGSSCSSGTIDYYLLPSDLQDSYLRTFQPSSTSGSPSGDGSPPSYLERFTEQVILLDWPIFTPASILDIVSSSEDDYSSSSSSSSSSTGSAASFPSSSSSAVSHEEPPQSPYQPQQQQPPHAPHAPHDLHFIPNELEGKVFFEGQPVALLPIDPSFLHPLMDEALISLLHSIHDLQLLIVIPEIFATVLPSSSPQSPSLSEYQLQSKYLSLEWAKKLVRRLSAKALASGGGRRGSTGSGGGGGEGEGEGAGGGKGRRGNAHQRIRLFPQPLSDSRLISLMKQVDIILDTFPIGNSLYPLALGLSVGTPIITLRSGVTAFNTTTPLETGPGLGLGGEEKEMRSFLFSQSSREKYSRNVLYQHIVQKAVLSNSTSSSSSSSSGSSSSGSRSSLQLPWLPSVSSVAALYGRMNNGLELQRELVGESVRDYVELAKEMLVNREKAYDTRIKILEHLDFYLLSQSDSGSSGRGSGSGAMDDSMRDLERFASPYPFSPLLLN